MTVRVGFQLRRFRHGPSAPAVALFIPGREASGLLAVCEAMGFDPSGCVHDVDGGFLLKLARPEPRPVPGATRLRELAPEFFVPVDAELIPALLDDEAAGLVRDGGLVLLPDGRALRFARRAPVRLPDLVTVAVRPRRGWESMPELPPLADRIVEISREWTEPPPEELYKEWEEETLRPRPSPVADSGEEAEGVDGGAAGGSGAEAGALGRSFRKMFGRAGSGVRSMGEKMRWGMLDHSGLVRKLLKEFRHGDGEEALRHALPMRPVDARSRVVNWAGRLPFRRAVYNLLELLGGGPPRGAAVGIWQAGPDLVEELKAEYRKAAIRAIALGDFRRAAYIFGMLLGDDRSAAMALQRGGLHHDAAILFLRKLDDKLAAASAFAAAGMLDRAIALYRELGRDEDAGELLRRIGDEAGAINAFRAAAARARAATPCDWLASGRILLYKAFLRDEAIECFAGGWAQRPGANAIACSRELVSIHAAAGEVEPLRVMLDEAEDFFGLFQAARDAESFYNWITAATSVVPALAGFAEEVRDRARLALAEQLRREVACGRPPSPSVSSLFGQPTIWPASVARDAQFAATMAAEARVRDRAAPLENPSRALDIQVGEGLVVSGCQAAATGEIFLCQPGQMHAFRPGRNQVVIVDEARAEVFQAVATDPDGQVVVTARQHHGTIVHCLLRRPDGSFRRSHTIEEKDPQPPWLTPVVVSGAQCFVGIANGRELKIAEVTSGLVSAQLRLDKLDEPPVAALLVSHDDTFRILTHDGPRWVLLNDDGRVLSRSEAAWRPHGGSRSSRCAIPLSWTRVDGYVKVTGLDEHGGLHTSHFCIEDDVLSLISTAVVNEEGGYLAATRVGSGKVVAVSARRVDWFSDSSDRLPMLHSVPQAGLESTVACFASAAPREVLVVSDQGRIARIQAPRIWKIR